MRVDPVTAGELARTRTPVLSEAGIASPETDVQRLLEEACGRERVPRDLALSEDEVRRFDDLVRRRAAREPLQRILGRTWFRTLTLRCPDGVFIPRPETEIVAGAAIEAARRRGPRPVVVDVCTGTGVIALSVAAEVDGAQVVAADLSAKAVAAARSNLDLVQTQPGLAPGADVQVVPSNLLAQLDQRLRGKIDVLVSNPPYLPASDRGTWEPEVADHDPDLALVGGPDGHEIVRSLLQAAGTWLAPGGAVVIEIDDRRPDDASREAERLGLEDVAVVRDLTGRPRAVRAVRPARLTAAGRSAAAPTLPSESPS